MEPSSNAVTTVCTVIFYAASSLYGEALYFRRWCSRANLNWCHAWGSRVTGPSFQILWSGDTLSWVRTGRLDCTWSVLYRRSRSHMEWGEVLRWFGTDIDKATAPVTIFCLIWCCDFKSSCLYLAWDLLRFGITCAGAPSCLDCTSLFLRVCINACFAAMCLSADE